MCVCERDAFVSVMIIFFFFLSFFFELPSSGVGGAGGTGCVRILLSPFFRCPHLVRVIHNILFYTKKEQIGEGRLFVKRKIKRGCKRGVQFCFM